MKTLILISISLALVISCAPSVKGDYKVTIDDGNPTTPMRTFHVSTYYWSDSGALCYRSVNDSLEPFSCYMKSINETITVEPIKEER